MRYERLPLQELLRYCGKAFSSFNITRDPLMYYIHKRDFTVSRESIFWANKKI